MSICSWRVFVYTKTSLLLRTTAIRGGSNAVDALRFAKANDRHVIYDLDGRGRVTEVSDRKQYFKVRAFYDENDREIKRILGNGNKQDYTYDEAGRLLGIVETDGNMKQ